MNFQTGTIDTQKHNAGNDLSGLQMQSRILAINQIHAILLINIFSSILGNRVTKKIQLQRKMLKEKNELLLLIGQVNWIP